MASIDWKEVDPDVKLRSLSEALRRTDYLTAIRVTANLMLGVRIYILRKCNDAIMAHVSSDSKEVGGLLLGEVWLLENAGVQESARPLVILIEAIASADYRNTSVSLEMGTDLWNRARAQSSGERIVVGWYHSHPNLGAFFSGTDRRTQKAFFTQPYSLGMVIDPFRVEQKVFVGKDSEEYHPPILELNHGLAMA